MKHIKAVLNVRQWFGGTVKAFVAISAFALTGTAWATIYYETIDGIKWYYEEYGDNRCRIYNNGIESAIPTSTAGAVTVPSSINGLEVAQIGDRAFYNCSNITRITIPNTVMNIGGSAFEGCGKLERFDVVGQSLTTIGEYAFKGCSSLSATTLPDSITAIGQCAFQNCTSLTRMPLPSGLKTVSYRLFWDCTNLIRVTGPVGANIDEQAFQGCSSLEQAIVPIKYINDASLVANSFGGTPANLNGYPVFVFVSAYTPATAEEIAEQKEMLTGELKFRKQEAVYSGIQSWILNSATTVVRGRNQE